MSNRESIVDPRNPSAGKPPEFNSAKIAVNGVSRAFQLGAGTEQKVTALQDVTFTVREGEFVSIIGPSGCGKTTLLRIIASLTHADSGEVLIDGRPATKPGPERAMVFQHFGLYPWKTVLDNVTFPLILRKTPTVEANAIAREQLSRVGLSKEFERSHPHQLSGGMQQRVGLARALATDADILLMDEPFGAIDAQTREFLQDDLSRLCSQSAKTVVIVTHDIDEAVLLADRVLVLTSAPGQVREIVDVDLPSPRWEYDVRGHHDYPEIRRHVWDLLRSQLTRGPSESGS